MSHLQRILDEETICKSMNCGLCNVMDEEKKRHKFGSHMLQCCITKNLYHDKKEFLKN